MDEYVCIYDEKYVMNHCVKLKANNVDDAYKKFVEFLSSERNISYIDKNNLYLINFSYLKEI